MSKNFFRGFSPVNSYSKTQQILKNCPPRWQVDFFSTTKEASTYKSLAFFKFLFTSNGAVFRTLIVSYKSKVSVSKYHTCYYKKGVWQLQNSLKETAENGQQF